MLLVPVRREVWVVATEGKLVLFNCSIALPLSEAVVDMEGFWFIRKRDAERCARRWNKRRDRNSEARLAKIEITASELVWVGKER